MCASIKGREWIYLEPQRSRFTTITYRYLMIFTYIWGQTLWRWHLSLFFGLFTFQLCPWSVSAAIMPCILHRCFCFSIIDKLMLFFSESCEIHSCRSISFNICPWLNKSIDHNPGCMQYGTAYRFRTIDLSWFFFGYPSFESSKIPWRTVVCLIQLNNRSFTCKKMACLRCLLPVFLQTIFEQKLFSADGRWWKYTWIFQSCEI